MHCLILLPLLYILATAVDLPGAVRDQQPQAPVPGKSMTQSSLRVLHSIGKTVHNKWELTVRTQACESYSVS